MWLAQSIPICCLKTTVQKFFMFLWPSSIRLFYTHLDKGVYISRWEKQDCSHFPRKGLFLKKSLTFTLTKSLFSVRAAGKQTLQVYQSETWLKSQDNVTNALGCWLATEVLTSQEVLGTADDWMDMLVKKHRKIKMDDHFLLTAQNLFYRDGFHSSTSWIMPLFFHKHC